MEQAVTPTSAGAWTNKVEVQGIDLPVPSGNVARVRQLSPQAFMASGLIPDPLSAIIHKAIDTKKGLPPKMMEDMASDPKKLAAAMEMFDRVLCYVVVEPKVLMPPTCKHTTTVNNLKQRCNQMPSDVTHIDPSHTAYHVFEEGDRVSSDEALYADQVAMDDKMFIFQWCMGGTKDLESFRSEFDGSLETVSDK